MTTKQHKGLWFAILALTLTAQARCYVISLDKNLENPSETSNPTERGNSVEASNLNSQNNSQSSSDDLDLNIDKDSLSEEQLLKRILSRMDSNGQTESINSGANKRSISRARRSIFGRDNRVSLGTSLEAQTYPYSTVVTLSSGCTGTLIGVQHVLTSAHCIHNGAKFLKQAKNLKIGMLQRSGSFRWIKVRRVFLPKAWKRETKRRRIKYDYAVLELRRSHSRPFMSVQPSNLQRGSPMQFAGFHSDKWFNSMWYSQCRVVVVIRGAVLSFCDGQKGISGSGVYVRSGSGIKKAVVGIVSAVGTGRLRGKRQTFNIVIALDQRKVKHISKWMRRLKRKRS